MQRNANIPGIQFDELFSLFLQFAHQFGLWDVQPRGFSPTAGAATSALQLKLPAHQPRQLLVLILLGLCLFQNVL